MGRRGKARLVECGEAGQVREVGQAWLVEMASRIVELRRRVVAGGRIIDARPPG